MKQKVKSAPKELVRRGLDDGTERLRGQLRDTAQRGQQADDYGGDRIEDTAAGGVKRTMRGAERGAEALLKRKKKDKRRISDEGSRAPSGPPEPLLEPPVAQEPLAEPSPLESPQIKTREAVAARESGTAPSLRGGTEPAPTAGSERQRIKIRESAVRDAHADTPPEPREGTDLPQIRTRESAVHDAPAGKAVREVRTNAGADPLVVPERPQIKTKDSVAGAPPDHIEATTATPSRSRTSDRLAIKTKDAYIQRQPSIASDQPSQAFVQGQQSFIREQGRKAAVKRSEAQRMGNGAGPQVRGREDVASPAPMRRAYASTHSITQAVSPGSPDTQPVREGGSAIVKTARSVRKAPKRAAGHAVKTADRSSRQTIKTTRRTAKAAGRTVKTAQKTAKATVKATQQTVQTARATAKAAATTAKATAKATIAALKGAIAALQALAGAIAAGGWVAVVIVLVLCLAGFLVASPFGIFFSGDSPDALTPSAAVAQISQEYADALSGLEAGGDYDSVEVVGRPPSWGDVFAVFAVKTVSGDGMDVIILDAERVDRLRTVFWDMTKITTEVKTVDHPATDDEEAWTETVLVITVTPRTVDDMRVFYSFTEEQNELLDALLAADSRDLWNQLLYGSTGEIVAVALSQVGNVGGQIYWSWYGFSDHVNWCACFVSWCANECGYIDAGIIPRFSSCTAGSNWFKNRGQWKDNSYEPRPGDLIFFDWDRKGSSGPQDDVPDHVGIVERVENGVVYTVEGNSSDSCRQRSYSVGHYEIWGYATPIY